jgi:hypothetical protein
VEENSMFTRVSRLITLAVVVMLAVALAPALPKAQAATNTIGYGDVVNGQITQANYFEIWEFTGSKGDRAQVLMQGDGSLDPYLGLLDGASQEVLAEDDDSAGNGNAYIELTLPASGSFLIVATRYDFDQGTSQGAYSLALTASVGTQPVVNPNPSAEPVELQPGVYYMGDLTLNQSASGTVDSSAFAQLYSLQIEQGTDLVVAMLADSSALDPYLGVLDPAGNVVAEDDNSAANYGGGAKDAYLRLTIPQSGEYIVVAARAGFETGLSTGAYVLVAGVPDEPEPAPEPEDDLPPGVESFGMIEVDATSSATISSDSYVHIYGFDGQAGEQVTITMRGEGSLDAYLGLLSPNDEVIAEDDDSGGGTDAQISIRLPETGTYVIIATRNGFDTGTSTGNYTLFVTSGPPPAPSGQTGQIGGFGGLPGRAIEIEGGPTFYLRGSGASDDPAKNTGVEAFAGSVLPGRGGLNFLRPVSQFSLNFEEIK